MNILQFLRQQAKDYDCNVCGQNHARSDIRVLGRLESAWIVKVTCSRCQTSFKLLVVVDESTGAEIKREMAGAPSARVATAKAMRERRKPPLTVDEVLDAHEFLTSYEGDLRSLFKRQRTAAATGAASDAD